MVPKLRFNQFHSSWCAKKLGEVGEIISGLTYSPENIRNYGLLVLRSSNIQGGKLCFEDCVYVDLIVDDEKKTRKNDILICVRNGSRSLIGKNTLIKEVNQETTHGAFMTVFRGPLNCYVAQLLQTKKFYNQVYSDLGATINSINGGNLKKYSFSFPSDFNETAKISDFLSYVDEKITLLNKQYNLLCQYKKGMMQKIFSQKVKFRNEKGNAYPAWKIKPFRTVYNLLGTNSLSRNELNYDNGIIKNIHYGDVHTKFNCRFDINKELVPYISNQIKVAEGNFCRKGDLVIADASEDYNDIGKCIEIMNVGQRQMVAGLHTFLARPSTHMAPGFGCYMMRSSEVRKQIKVIATGVSVLSITKKNFLELMVPLPSIEEQTKIANFLASVDDKIIIKKAEVDKLKTWKQGLLQQMFI